MKLVFAAFILLTYTAHAKQSVELNVPLTLSGFSWISEKVDTKKVKSRRDIYMDVFNLDHFMLRQNGLKFRLKQNKNKLSVQVSQKVKTQKFQCNAAVFTVNTTNSQRTDVSPDEGAPLVDHANYYFKMIEDESVDIWPVIIDYDVLIRELEFPGKQDLFEFIGEGLIVPSQWNEKVRFVYKLDIDGEEHEVILGQTFDREVNGEPRVRYELEFEFNIKDENELSAVVDKLCRAIGLDQLSAEHISAPLPNGDIYYSNLLKNKLTYIKK